MGRRQLGGGQRWLSWLLVVTPWMTACPSDDGAEAGDGASTSVAADDGGGSADDPATGNGDGADDADDSGGSPSATYEPCPDATAAGTFVVQLQDGFTQVEGQVDDGPDPNPKEVVDEVGGCRLVRRINNFCDPPCAVSDVCDAQEACVAKPTAVDLGTVRVDGLTAPVAMTPGPTNFYLNLDTLPHPAFSTGTSVTLTADGGEVGGFSLSATGVDSFALDQTEIAVVEDQPVPLSWDVPPADVVSGVRIVLDIGHHGGSTATIECDAEDTGTFEIPATLVTQLFGFGVAGFPVIEIERRAASSTMADSGCVELIVAPTAVAMEVSIEGITSCSTDADCPEGQTCQADLSCTTS